MRVRLTGVLLAVVVTAAASGIASSAASAAVFTLTTTACTGGTFLNLCYVNGTEKLELTGTQTFSVVQLGKGILKGIIGGEAVTVECEETVATGTPLVNQASPLTAKGTITGTLTFKKCKVIGNATVVKKCKIPVEKESTKLVGSLNSVSELLLKPETGTEFIIIPFENNGTEVCPATIKGNRAVTGEQAITITTPEEPAEEKTGKTVVKSGLKLAGEPAELEASLDLMLTGLGDKWYITSVA